MLFSKASLLRSLKSAKEQLNGMKFELSISEELEKVNVEISKLMRCKKVLEAALASQLRKR